MRRVYFLGAAVLIFATLVAGCENTKDAAPPSVPSFEPTAHKGAASDRAATIGPARRQEALTAGPVPPSEAAAATARVAATRIPLKPTVEALSLEQVSLPNFINEVFSKALSLTVQIDQRVLTRTDIVTLRTGRQLPSEELFRMAENVLAGYGVGVVWDGSVLHIAPEDALMAQMPDIIRSRALPEM